MPDRPLAQSLHRLLAAMQPVRSDRGGWYLGDHFRAGTSQARLFNQSVGQAALAKAANERDRKAESANHVRVGAIRSRVAEIDQRLAADFPSYAALARAVPLTVQQVQALLSADEALLQFVDTSEEVFVWAVTKNEVRWVRLDLDAAALKRE